MENGESCEQAALRETREEACANVDIQQLFCVISVTHISQVHLFYLAEMSEPEFGAGEESLEVGLFSQDKIPWSELAFPTVEETLKQYFEIRAANGLLATPQPAYMLTLGSNRRIA